MNLIQHPRWFHLEGFCFGRAGVTLRHAVIAGLLFFTAYAYADDSSPPYATYKIVVESNSRLSQAPTALKPITKDHVSFQIVNNTRGVIYFVNGDQKLFIPMVSENTVTVPYSPSENPEYKIMDEAGTVLLRWKLNYPVQNQVTVSSTSQELFSQWEQSIQSVLEATRNRSVLESSSPQKSEPVYNESSSPEKSEPVYHDASSIHRVIRHSDFAPPHHATHRVVKQTFHNDNSAQQQINRLPIHEAIVTLSKKVITVGEGADVTAYITLDSKETDRIVKKLNNQSSSQVTPLRTSFCMLAELTGFDHEFEITPSGKQPRYLDAAFKKAEWNWRIKANEVENGGIAGHEDRVVTVTFYASLSSNQSCNLSSTGTYPIVTSMPASIQVHNKPVTNTPPPKPNPPVQPLSHPGGLIQFFKTSLDGLAGGLGKEIGGAIALLLVGALKEKWWPCLQPPLKKIWDFLKDLLSAKSNQPPN